MIENALKNAGYAINTSGSAVDRAQATKKCDKYIKQLAEISTLVPDTKVLILTNQGIQ